MKNLSKAMMGGTIALSVMTGPANFVFAYTAPPGTLAPSASLPSTGGASGGGTITPPSGPLMGARPSYQAPPGTLAPNWASPTAASRQLDLQPHYPPPSPTEVRPLSPLSPAPSHSSVSGTAVPLPNGSAYGGTTVQTPNGNVYHGTVVVPPSGNPTVSGGAIINPSRAVPAPNDGRPSRSTEPQVPMPEGR